MSKQTTLDDLGLTDGDTQESETATDTDESPATTGTPLPGTPEQPARDAWVADRLENDEPYGYCQVYLKTHSDLTGVEYALHYTTQIDCSPVEHSCATTSGDSWVGGDVETTRAWLIQWWLDVLATPYHPDLRPFPRTHLRVFVTDAANDYLTDQGTDIKSLQEHLQTLPKHTPTETYLAHYREQKALKEWLRADEGLKTHERRIEATIRARFGFTKRYGSQVPDSHPAYDSLSLDALRECLERVRAQITTATDRRDELRDTLSAARSAWIDQTRREHFKL